MAEASVSHNLYLICN